MTPRDLNRLLHAASSAPVPPVPATRVRAVWECIARGWDPERIEWQRWLRRWWPWVALTVLAAAVIVAAWPHGSHEPAAQGPPVMQMFHKAAGTPGRPAIP